MPAPLFDMSQSSFIAVWHNGPWKKVISDVVKGMGEGLELYKNSLKSRINHWGSVPAGPTVIETTRSTNERGATIAQLSAQVPVGGDVRLMIATSFPNFPPLKQTSNLYNSIRRTVVKTINRRRVMLGFPNKTAFDFPLLEGRVQTDVPYAKALEEGGTSSSDPDKPYTGITLIGIDTSKIRNIAARPAWVPTFLVEKGNMVEAVKKNVSS